MNGIPGARPQKNFSKKIKKVLTRKILSDRMNKLSAWAATVPCKLNNVRQTITPWTINGLFERCISKLTANEILE